MIGWGRGEHPTVTDAALTLGYIDPNYFLGGRIGLDTTAAKVALEGHVAGPLGLDLHAAAAAVMHVVTENMVAAIDWDIPAGRSRGWITVNQGIDPRHAVLVGGGVSRGVELGCDCSASRLPAGSHSGAGGGVECRGRAVIGIECRIRGAFSNEWWAIRYARCERDAHRAQ